MVTPSGTHPRDLSGRYELGDEVGVGGTGVVRRAYDCLLDREVAHKQLRVPRVLLHQAGDNPLTLGMLHHDLALVAITVRDLPTFEHHARCAQEYFFRCSNPGLMARYEQLLSRARRAGLTLESEPDAKSSVYTDSLDELDHTVLEAMPDARRRSGG